MKCRPPPAAPSKCAQSPTPAQHMNTARGGSVVAIALAPGRRDTDPRVFTAGRGVLLPRRPSGRGRCRLARAPR